MNDIETELTEFSERISFIATEVENRYKGEYRGYNVLDYLTKHHLEEFHTNFISDLLNPKGKHESGGKFLKAFMDVVRQKRMDESAGFIGLSKQLQRLNNEDYNKAVVEKELRIRNTNDPTIYGRIDVFIKFPAKKINVVLENKIYSSEGDNQLGRYDGYCRTLGGEFSILYLTLHGDVPMSSKGVDYVSISYHKQIENWLEKCLGPDNNKALEVGIKSYRNMLHTKFFDSKYERLMNEIKDIITNPENKQLLKYQVAIKDALIPVRNYYRDKFFKGVEYSLKDKGCKFELLDEQLNRIEIEKLWHKKNNGVLFIGIDYTYKIAHSKTCHVLIEHDWNFLDYGFVVVSEGKEGNVRKYSSDFSDNADIKKIAEEIMNKFQDESMWSTKQMFAMKRFKPETLDGTRLDFPDDNLNYSFAENMEEIVKEFVANIETYLKVFKEIIEGMERDKKQIL